MLFEIILLLLAIPSGLLVAYLARDELVQGRKWFLILIGISIACALAFFTMQKVVEGNTSAFIAIVSAISYWKSFDKKWTTRFRKS